jgi:hypothetical protein
MSGITLPTVAIPKTVDVEDTDQDDETQPPKRRKQALPPCDDPDKAKLAKGGQFRWAACESIVFEWAVNDPTQLADTERGNLFRDRCESKEELH